MYINHIDIFHQALFKSGYHENEDIFPDIPVDFKLNT